MTGHECRLREKLAASRQQTRRLEVELRMLGLLGVSRMTLDGLMGAMDADPADVEVSLANLIRGRAVKAVREDGRVHFTARETSNFDELLSMIPTEGK